MPGEAEPDGGGDSRDGGGERVRKAAMPENQADDVGQGPQAPSDGAVRVIDVGQQRAERCSAGGQGVDVHNRGDARCCEHHNPKDDV